MTFVIDDLLVRPLVGLVGILHDMAIRELHDVEDLQKDLKENRLLYEIGDREEETYAERKADLEDRIDEAREAREQLSGRAEVIR